MNKRLISSLGAVVAIIVLGTYAGNEIRAWQRSHATGRNRIVNGDFDRWATQGTVTVGSRTAMVTAIGWVATADGTGGAGRATLSRHVLNVYGQPPLPILGWNQSPGATAGAPSLTQAIPSAATFAGRDAVLSFYARADAPVDMVAMLVQSYGTSAQAKVTADRTVAVVRFTLDPHWRTFAFPLSLPAVKNVTMGDPGTDVLRLSFVPDRSTATFTLEITQVQLESGRAPTPFEARQPAASR